MRCVEGQFLLLLILSTISVNYCFDKYLSEQYTNLMMSLDFDTNQCDNFYQFACGKIADKHHYQPFNMMRRNFFIDIIDTFNTEDIYSSDEKFLMEKQYYDACMDEAPDSVSNSMDVYRNILNLTTLREKRRWQNVAEYYASEIGDAFLFHFSLSKRNILQVLRPFHLKLTDVYNDDSTKKLIDAFLLSKCGENSNCPKEMFRKQFHEFVEVMHKFVTEKPMTILTVTIQKVQEMYDSHYFVKKQNINSQINWLRFLQAFAPNNGQLLESSHIIRIDSTYLEELPTILASTSSNVIINYMMFQFEYYYDLRAFSSSYLASPYDRSYQCITSQPITEGVVNFLMNSNEFKKKERFLREQFNFISEYMKEELQNSWLNDRLKEWALQEIENVTLEIAQTRIKKNPFVQEKIITSYDFVIGSNFMENYCNFKKAQADRMIKIYLENGNSLTNHGRKKRQVLIDLEYRIYDNTILIEPKYLSIPMFYQKAPLAYNFGRIGHLVAHELSHAVCFEKVFPKDSVDLKHPFYSHKFDKNTKCLANQYYNLNVDGHSTLKENYADNLALKVAYNAMEYAINNNLMAENLYNLPSFQEYTSEQLFFLSYANMHCTMPIKTFGLSMHSPAFARVNIPLMNMKEFAQAFNCPIDSPMNPTEKCDFWKN